MVKVQAKGDVLRIANPAKAGEVTVMQNVVFIEEGRSGAQSKLANSSNLLSQALQAETGLEQTRTHTQPVKIEEANKLEIGQEIPGLHINRELSSVPQIRGQVGKPARMADGRPTYFVTFFGNKPEDDIDNRLPLEKLVDLDPNIIKNAQIGATEMIRENADGSGRVAVMPNVTTVNQQTIPSAVNGNQRSGAQQAQDAGQGGTGAAAGAGS